MKWLSMIGEWQRRGLGYMAAGLSLIGGLFSLSGCGSGDGAAGPTDPDPQGSPPGQDEGAEPQSAANSRQPSAIANAARETASPLSKMKPLTPEGAAAGESAVIDGDQWLDEQIRLAAKFRQEGDYRGEAAQWDRTVATLERSIGPGNWITAGARLSRQVAHRLAELTPEQRERWKKFEALEVAFLQNRREMAELRGGGQIAPEQYVNATKEQLEILGQQSEIVQDLFGQPSHLLANIAYHQAETLMAVEQWAPAFVAAEKCLAQRQAVILVRHPDSIAALKMMGQIAQQMNNLSLAEDCLVKATHAAEQVWGTNNLAYASHANDLGVFYYAVETQKAASAPKDYAKANYWLERGLQLRRELLGESHGLVALSRRNYALSKMAEATAKPQDRQALDLALANSLITDALQILRDRRDASSADLIWQVTSEAATIKMLVQEYQEADDLLGEIATQWREHPQDVQLPISPATLYYRWGLAQARQKSPDKLSSAEKLMEQAIRFGLHTDGDGKTVAAARQALERLQFLAAGGQNDVIADRQPDGPTVSPNPQLARQHDSTSPVRVVALPAIDEQ